MKDELELLCRDYPAANGRKPPKNEVAYTFRFPLEDGRELVLRMGQEGFDTHTDLMMSMLANMPSYSDGSTNPPKG